MSAFIVDWLNLLFRWAHLMVGIGWIGTSFYFIALDLSLRKRERHARGRLRHRLGSAWRRLLSRREISGGAEDAAAAISSGTNGRPISPGSPASPCSSSSIIWQADTFLIDRR